MRRKDQIRQKDGPKPLVKTFRFRVKDSSTDGRVLSRMARSVNAVWNHCNAAGLHAIKFANGYEIKWPDDKALQDSTRGASRLLGISSQTIQAICEEHSARRAQFKKAKLRFRGRKSLGWVPFKNQTFKLDTRGNTAVYCGHTFRLWKHRDLPGGSRIKSGSFSQDARGRWYCNVAVEYLPISRVGNESVGIDLGLKDTATLSTGDKVVNARVYAKHETGLACAQRAGKTRRARAINAKIANVRKDFLHNETTKIADRFGFIAVGDVNGKWLQASNGKSSADAATGMFRNLLRYKAVERGAVFIDVSEHLTTQTCSDCGAIGGPKGTQGLEIREWICECGAVHDRDVNSAKCILRIGLDTLVEGAPLSAKGKRSPGLQAGE